MKHAITRFPVLISATFFLITGVVFAQVLPEEPLPEVTQVVEGSFDIVPEPATATTTEDSSMSDSGATSTPDNVVSTEISSSTKETQNKPETISIALSSTTNDMDIKNTLFDESDEVHSLKDLVRPQQCHTVGAKAFFDTIGECVRFVTAKISDSKREQFEERLNQQPRELLE